MSEIEKLQAKAEAGDANAQFLLGEAYFYGKGVDRDYRKGVCWFCLATRQGHVDAPKSLGMAYKLGTGVGSKNAIYYSCVWYNVALLAETNDNAKSLIEIALAEMPPDQIAKAKRLAHKIHAKIYS